MKSRHDPEHRPGGERGPSEISDAFPGPVAPLTPPPGTYEDVRRRARARRRTRGLWAGIAAVGCVAACGVAVGMTQGQGPSTVASVPDRTTAQETTGRQHSSGPTDEETGTSTPAPQDKPTATGTQPTGKSPSAGTETRNGTAGEPPACRTADLTVTLGPGEGAAGSIYRSLRMTNDADGPCVLRGFPGVSMVDAAGHQLGKPADRTGGAPNARIVLKPGQREKVTLRVIDAAVYTDDRCDKADAAGVRVYPPEQRASVVVPVKGLEGCASSDVTTMTVTAFGTLG